LSKQPRENETKNLSPRQIFTFPFGEGGPPLLRWWMRCSHSPFRSAKYKSCDNPSASLRSAPPSARGRLGLHLGIASLVQKGQGSSPLTITARQIFTFPFGEGGPPLLRWWMRYSRSPFRSANIHLPPWGRGTAALAVVDEVFPFPLPLGKAMHL